MHIMNFVFETIPSKINRFISHYVSARPMTRMLEKRFNNKELVGVELGTHGGRNAYNIIRWLNIKHLYLIDPYQCYWEDGKLLDFSAEKLKAESLLKPFSDRVTFIHKFSSDAVDRIPDNLDFIYIDGNHNYDFVKKDIELYYPKVKVGGIFGGHDFNAAFLGVVDAVNEYAKKNNLEIQGSTSGTDWWVVKKPVER